jgi:hypothetical protein
MSVHEPCLLSVSHVCVFQANLRVLLMSVDELERRNALLEPRNRLLEDQVPRLQVCLTPRRERAEVPNPGPRSGHPIPQSPPSPARRFARTAFLSLT